MGPFVKYWSDDPVIGGFCALSGVFDLSECADVGWHGDEFDQLNIVVFNNESQEIAEMYIEDRRSEEIESPYGEFLEFDSDQYPEIPENMFINMARWDEDTDFAKTSYLLWASHDEYIILGMCNDRKSYIPTEDVVDMLLLIVSKTIQKIDANR
jgi:hypothetical protein